VKHASDHESIPALCLYTVRVLPWVSGCHVAYLRRYRSRRAGRPRRPEPVLRPVGNGSIIVACQPVRRVMNGVVRPRKLTQLRHCLSADSSSVANQLHFALLNIRLLANKVDDLLEIRRDRSIDVVCLVDT